MNEPVEGQVLELPPSPGDETQERRDYILASVLSLCLLGAGGIVGAEYISGMAAAHADMVLKLYEITIVSVLTGHFALARPSR